MLSKTAIRITTLTAIKSAGALALYNIYPKRYISPQIKKAQSLKIGPWMIWLPGTDSNCRPSGYKCPDISTRLGLSHHPSLILVRAEGVGRFPRNSPEYEPKL